MRLVEYYSLIVKKKLLKLVDPTEQDHYFQRANAFGQNYKVREVSRKNWALISSIIPLLSAQLVQFNRSNLKITLALSGGHKPLSSLYKKYRI